MRRGERGCQWTAVTDRVCWREVGCRVSRPVHLCPLVGHWTSGRAGPCHKFQYLLTRMLSYEQSTKCILGIPVTEVKFYFINQHAFMARLSFISTPGVHCPVWLCCLLLSHFSAVNLPTVLLALSVFSSSFSNNCFLLILFPSSSCKDLMFLPNDSGRKSDFIRHINHQWQESSP